MHEPGKVVRLIAIQTVCMVVLGQSCAITERFTDSQGMKKPMGSSGVDAGQAVGGSSEESAHQIVGKIPITKPTAQEHRELRLDIHSDEIEDRTAFVPGPGSTQRAHFLLV